MVRSKGFKNKFFGTMFFIYLLLTIYLVETIPVYAHYFGLGVFVLGFLSSVFIERKKIFISRSLLLFCIFTFWAVISFFWSVNEVIYADRLQRILFNAIAVFFFFNFLKWYDIRNYFLWGIIVGGFVNFLIFFNLFPYYFSTVDQDTWRFAGTFGNANVLSFFMSFSILASVLLLNFFYKNRGKIIKTALVLNIPLCLYIIVQTGSRTGFAMGFSMLFLFFLPYFKSIKSTITALFFIILFMATFLYMLNDDDFSEQFEFVFKRFESAQETIEGTGAEGSTEMRFFYINKGIKIWLERPFVGVGLDNFSHYHHTYAHNNYVEILATLGLIGFILLYSFYYNIFLSFLHVKDLVFKVTGIFSLLIFLIMDFGTVSYYNAIYLMFLIYLSQEYNSRDGADGAFPVASQHLMSEDES